MHDGARLHAPEESCQNDDRLKSLRLKEEEGSLSGTKVKQRRTKKLFPTTRPFHCGTESDRFGPDSSSPSTLAEG